METRKNKRKKRRRDRTEKKYANEKKMMVN